MYNTFISLMAQVLFKLLKADKTEIRSVQNVFKHLLLHSSYMTHLEKKSYQPDRESE